MSILLCYKVPSPPAPQIRLSNLQIQLISPANRIAKRTKSETKLTTVHCRNFKQKDPESRINTFHLRSNLEIKVFHRVRQLNTSIFHSLSFHPHIFLPSRTQPMKQTVTSGGGDKKLPSPCLPFVSKASTKIHFPRFYFYFQFLLFHYIIQAVENRLPSI